MSFIRATRVVEKAREVGPRPSGPAGPGAGLLARRRRVGEGKSGLPGPWRAGSAALASWAAYWGDQTLEPTLVVQSIVLCGWSCVFKRRSTVTAWRTRYWESGHSVRQALYRI